MRNEPISFPSYLSDDITMTADGVDTYHLVKAAGRYKYVTLCYLEIKGKVNVSLCLVN